MYSESYIRKHGLKLAIVGRPNVGKSTLFNRLTGKKMAIVDDMPGVTRDRREAFGQIGDIPLLLIDTAGLDAKDDSALMQGMRDQVKSGLDQANVICFMIDARQGITPQDRSLAQTLREIGKPVVVLANKCEGNAGDAGMVESFELGFDEAIAISAEHGLGMDDLFQSLIPHWKKPDISSDDETEEEEENLPLHLAIIGRPNVGKSTLINSLLGFDRVLTGPEAGVTRDSIAIDWEYNGRNIKLHDTAGIRKRAKVTEKVEKLAVADSLKSMQYAQVVIMVIDVTQPFEKQDLNIAAKAADEGRCIVIAANKWDLVENKAATMEELRYQLDRTLPQIKDVPCIPISANNAKNLDKLMQAVFDIYEVWNRRLSTSKLNRWLEGIIDHHPPPIVAGRRIKIKYITQIKTRPPSFVMFSSKSDELPAAYQRYLVNALRQDFKMAGIPIRLEVKSGKNPYAK